MQELNEFTTDENFEELFNQRYGEQKSFTHNLVKGTIVSITSEFVIVDVGLKSEGRIPLKEFGIDKDTVKLDVNDIVDVFIERYEDKDGLIVLSREKARREEAWNALETKFANSEQVEGIVNNRVKGGFTVDLGGAIAFLPGSQVDIHPIRDINTLIDNRFVFSILKMDKARSNIVVSRRAVLEEERAEQRNELIKNLSEGEILDGIVKNITDYGVFVDLGGIDGLLHITDISWNRINHPSEVLQIGQSIKVKIIRFNEQNQRISLGIKQLQTDPWKDVKVRFPIDSVVKSKVTNIADYGAFVSLAEGVEGLVHVSELSWARKNIHPSKMVTIGENLEVKIISVDEEKRRISLSLKQCSKNPWEEFSEQHKEGDLIEGPVKSVTEFGLFIGLKEDLDGMVHLSDISWNDDAEEILKSYNKGDKVKAKILSIDIKKERISLGIKQLENDPFTEAKLNVGDNIKTKVTKVTDNGLEVEIAQGINSFIKRADLAKDYNEQKVENYNIGSEIEAKITDIDHKGRSVFLSVKALEIANEKQAIAKLADEESSTATATLGDILKAAQNKEEG